MESKNKTRIKTLLSHLARRFRCFLVCLSNFMRNNWREMSHPDSSHNLHISTLTSGELSLLRAEWLEHEVLKGNHLFGTRASGVTDREECRFVNSEEFVEPEYEAVKSIWVSSWETLSLTTYGFHTIKKKSHTSGSQMKNINLDRIYETVAIIPSTFLF